MARWDFTRHPGQQVSCPIKSLISHKNLHQNTINWNFMLIPKAPATWSIFLLDWDSLRQRMNIHVLRECGGRNILGRRPGSCQFRYANVSLIVNNSVVMKWRTLGRKIKVIRSDRKGEAPPNESPMNAVQMIFGVTLLNFPKTPRAAYAVLGKFT